MSLACCSNGHLFNMNLHGKTCPYCPKFEDDMPETTEEIVEPIDPVVGWLVCVKGPNKGRDYRLVAQKNFIGRDQDMHIRILGDEDVSKRGHATVAFDPKKQTTTLSPGESARLVYLNGDAVYESKELETFNTIELGKSKFIYIGVCGDNFSWDRISSIEEVDTKGGI